MRRPQLVVLVAVLLFVAALWAAWSICAARAYHKTVGMLAYSELDFRTTIEEEVDGALRLAARSVIHYLGGEPRHLPPEEAADVANEFQLDELNVVGRDGVCIGSNIPDIMGWDFNQNPLTREFMALTNGVLPYYAQPFRNGVVNPVDYCKYVGISFPGGNGFVQIGFSFDRFVEIMRMFGDRDMRGWRIGETGWFEMFDSDGDGAPNRIGADAEDGEIYRVASPDGQLFCRPFTYAGKRFVAFLPAREYGEQRTIAFLVMVPAIAVVIILLASAMIGMSRASEKMEAFHAAEDARRAQDLAVARTIQTSSLPVASTAFPDRLEFAISADSEPAREVGGDFYDFYPVGDGRIAVLVADVSGKGISAAMFMMSAKNILKAFLIECATPAEAVAKANDWLCANNDAEMFVTAWIGVFDPSNGEVEFVNAGHNPPFIRRADGSVEKVAQRGGRFLGMFENGAYAPSSLRLAPGDTLFLYTYGITEAMDSGHRLFGVERLKSALARSGDACANVRSSVAEFTAGAEPSDDSTYLALSYFGDPKWNARDFACGEPALSAAMEFLGATVALPDAKARARLLNAADEIISNIVNYSGAKTLTVSIANGAGRCRVAIVDDGIEYNPLSHEDPDIGIPVDERLVGGLGILMAKKLVRELRYARDRGHNILLLLQ